MQILLEYQYLNAFCVKEKNIQQDIQRPKPRKEKLIDSFNNERSLSEIGSISNTYQTSNTNQMTEKILNVKTLFASLGVTSCWQNYCHFLNKITQLLYYSKLYTQLKDTNNIVKKQVICEASSLLDPFGYFVENVDISRPIKLQQDDHVTKVYIAPLKCFPSFLLKFTTITRICIIQTIAILYL